MPDTNNEPESGVVVISARCEGSIGQAPPDPSSPEWKRVVEIVDRVNSQELTTDEAQAMLDNG